MRFLTLLTFVFVSAKLCAFGGHLNPADAYSPRVRQAIEEVAKTRDGLVSASNIHEAGRILAEQDCGRALQKDEVMAWLTSKGPGGSLGSSASPIISRQSCFFSEDDVQEAANVFATTHVSNRELQSTPLLALSQIKGYGTSLAGGAQLLFYARLAEHALELIDPGHTDGNMNGKHSPIVSANEDFLRLGTWVEEEGNFYHTAPQAAQDWLNKGHADFYVTGLGVGRDGATHLQTIPSEFDLKTHPAIGQYGFTNPLSDNMTNYLYKDFAKRRLLWAKKGNEPGLPGLTYAAVVTMMLDTELISDLITEQVAEARHIFYETLANRAVEASRPYGTLDAQDRKPTHKDDGSDNIPTIDPLVRQKNAAFVKQLEEAFEASRKPTAAYLAYVEGELKKGSPGQPLPAYAQWKQGYTP